MKAANARGMANSGRTFLQGVVDAKGLIVP
jgi:hypothetical protein